MLDRNQTTAPEMVPPLPPEVETCPEFTWPSQRRPTIERYKFKPQLFHTSRLSAWASDRTVGRAPSFRYFPQYLDRSDLIRSAWETTQYAEDEEVAREARRLLLIVQEGVASLEERGLGLDNLPRLWASNIDDGSLLIEWVFNDFRIGLSVERDAAESSWYLVSSESLGGIRAFGYISGVDVRTLILWLLGFALANS